jgi:RNA polymerase sigma-70 factor (ECF subfamily)
VFLRCPHEAIDLKETSAFRDGFVIGALQTAPRRHDQTDSGALMNLNSLPAAELSRLRARMLAYARRGLRDADLAEDVTQDALAALAAAPGGFRGDAAFQTYAIGVLKHKMSDALRLRAREAPLDDEAVAALEGEAPASATVSASERAEFWRAVRARLQRLSPRERTVLWLRDVGEWDTRAVSQHVGVTESHAHVLLFRARRNLRALWTEGALAGAA